MNHYMLEVCVDCVESAVAAEKGGAMRLELCQNLVIGGTSPSPKLFERIKKRCSIPINVLLRPRFGDFCYTEHEFEILKEEVLLYNSLGASGVVIGVLLPDGTIDQSRMEVLMASAGNMAVTFHRAFDLTKDPIAALGVCKSLQVHTILTSGGQNSAQRGMELLKTLKEQSGDVEIMAGSGISSTVIREFLDHTAITAYHMSGKKDVDSPMIYRNPDVSMGLPLLSEYVIWRTDHEEIVKARAVLDQKRS